MQEEKMHSCNCDHEEGCGCNEEENCSCGGEGNCGCGCGEHEGLVVELEGENGELISCDVVDGFNYKGIDYILVENPEDSSVYLFRVDGDDEDSQLVIPDDEEFEEVSSFYESLLEE